MDGDYEGMDRFTMDGDYEGGEWIDGEFYYRSKRDRPVQTKDDAIYGSFAAADSSDDSADDSGRRSRRRRKGDVISKHDFSKPVQFVSTGTVMPSEKIDETSKKSEGNKSPNPGLGVSEKSNEEVESFDFLPTAFGRKITEGAMMRKKEKEREKEKEKNLSSTRSRGNLSREGIGGFENHTKGIGMKLMKMMGYKEGTGLGKNEQGIVAPVEAKLRPKNLGMGFNDYKEPKLPILQDVVLEKKAEVAVASVPVKEKRWLKKKQGRGRGEVLTADELLAKKQDQGVEILKVLDMRGPQVKVLRSLENLNAEEEMKENDVPMPELQYNVRLIVETTEVDIQKLDGALRREREKVVSLQREKEKIQKEEIRQRQQLKVMEMIASVLDRVKEENLSGVLTLDSLLGTFKDLKGRFGDEYKLCNISSIACAFAYPLLIRVFQGWDPLQNPLHGLHIMLSWRDLLQGDQPYDYSDGDLVSSPYLQLVNEVIFPAVRIAGTNTWQARDPEPMLRFIESWERLLPPVIVQSIMDNVVMHKLAAGVESWDPRRETVPIHVWIHPWLPYLGQKLETLYHTIRYKLGTVLSAWHASDASAHAILQPWRNVFDPASWEDLMVCYIVPKLMTALQEFHINPANQSLDQFHWVMKWASEVPVQHMVHLLEFNFFSKWHQVLYHWLCSHPIFDEVMEWYKGWKALFPSELIANERIRTLFDYGLEMMNQAVDGLEVVQPGVREHVSYLRATEKRHFEAQRQASGSMNGVGNMPQMSLKDLVQNYAMEQGLLFLPKVGKVYDGLPVYGFGNVNISIDSLKQVLYAQVQGRWNPVSLAELSELHRSGSHR